MNQSFTPARVGRYTLPNRLIMEGPALHRYLVAELDKLGLAYLHIAHNGDEQFVGDIRAWWKQSLILNRPGRPRKDILWRAAAEHAFVQIRTEWDILAPEGSELSPLARLRQEYTTLFRYTVAFPEFHRFMRQEALTNNPRLKWVAETVLAPLLARLLPQIIEAQKRGLLPAVDPILFHYMMVSLTAALSEFGPEMQVTSGLSSGDTKVVEAYWRLLRRRSSDGSRRPVAQVARTR
jgi:hypothetical protein